MGTQLPTSVGLGLSIFFSVTIVLVNKYLMSVLGFRYATLLTSWHLLVTFFGLHVAKMNKMFEHKPIGVRKKIGFSIANGLAIGFLNLCLGLNSIGFYQMTKLAIIPVTILLQFLFFQKRFLLQVQLSLLILLIGVGIATVTDLEFNTLGASVSIVTVCLVSWTQIITNTLQKEYEVTSTQLLYQTSSWMGVTLLILGPTIDKILIGSWFEMADMTPQVTVVTVVSCLIAIGVNFSTFFVIGRTSPITYQVVGHAKTCLVLIIGFTLFQSPVTFRNMCGILISLVGMVAYSYYSSSLAAKKDDPEAPDQEVVEEKQAAEEAQAEQPQAPLLGDSEAGDDVEQGGGSPKAEAAAAE